jgi:hypothetical protein
MRPILPFLGQKQIVKNSKGNLFGVKNEVLGVENAFF